MSIKKKFVLRGESHRQQCINYLYDLPLDVLPEGWKVVISENKRDRSLEQNDAIHGIIRDIQKSGRFTFMNRTDWTVEDIKRLLIDAFSRLKKAEGNPLRYAPEIVPSLDGAGVVQLNPRSRDFTVDEASEFIDYLICYGSEIGVKWSEVWTTT